MPNKKLCTLYLLFCWLPVCHAADTDNDGFADSVDLFPNDPLRPGVLPDGLGVFSGDDTPTANNFGFSVDGAGDVNQDGYADVIIGDWADTPGTDAVYVYSGRDGSLLHQKLLSNNVGAGAEGSGVGDVNQDGYDDFVVGEAYLDGDATYSGKATVYSGIDGAVLYTFEGNENQLMGGSVSEAGDVNKDGYPDIAVGAWGFGGSAQDNGRVFVFSGQDGSTLYEFTGDQSGDQIGAQLAVGDINNDSYPDLVVGQAYIFDLLNPRYVRVFSGFDGSVLYTFVAPAMNEGFGNRVASGVDINNDGYDDILVGDRETDSKVTIYSGFDGAILDEISELGQFGAVAGLPDITGDGYDEFAIGDSSAGKVTIHSGLDSEVLYTFYATAFNLFGFRVAYAGDVNANGYGDIIVGTWRNLGQDSGGAYIVTLLVDSDADGVPDWYETANGMDLLLNDSMADLDNDALLNINEYQLNTSANNNDSNSNGVLDPVEDSDKDGLPNITEIDKGLDPADASDGVLPLDETYSGGKTAGKQP